jgi:hypothetical protein
MGITLKLLRKIINKVWSIFSPSDISMLFINSMAISSLSPKEEVDVNFPRSSSAKLRGLSRIKTTFSFYQKLQITDLFDNSSGLTPPLCPIFLFYKNLAQAQI